jgi:hypothetical protein
MLAVGKFMGLNTLTLGVIGSMDESLCTAMKDGLGMNETLESLELKQIRLCDNNATLRCRTFSFLRTNKALKSLEVDASYPAMEPCVFTSHLDIACMLQANASL